MGVVLIFGRASYSEGFVITFYVGGSYLGLRDFGIVRILGRPHGFAHGTELVWGTFRKMHVLLSSVANGIVYGIGCEIRRQRNTI